MPLRIVRNDITKMKTDIIVNTANEYPQVGTGCDHAIFQAAGYEELLAYRKEKIGRVPEGEVFITPGFGLECRYIIHAVSPFFRDGSEHEEEKLRSCYRKSLQLALEHQAETIAFPLIATGGFGYPKEEGFRIAVDEINAFLLQHRITVFLVVFDGTAVRLGRNLDPKLESYIDQNYVDTKKKDEYDLSDYRAGYGSYRTEERRFFQGKERYSSQERCDREYPSLAPVQKQKPQPCEEIPDAALEFCEVHETALEERMKHVSDTFSEYLIYLIA